MSRADFAATSRSQNGSGASRSRAGILVVFAFDSGERLAAFSDFDAGAADAKHHPEWLAEIGIE